MPVLLDDPDYEAPALDPLHRAVSWDDLPKVQKWLVGRSAEERVKFFELGAHRGSMNVTRWFLEHGGADVHAGLRDAVCSGKVEMLELFLSLGARITEANSQSLFTAPSNTKMLAALVKHGLAPKTKSYDRTALMEVCKAGDLTSARTLLDGGSDVNARSREGTALTLAEGGGHRVLVDFLLERGAKPERAVIEPDAERDAVLAAATEAPRDAEKRRAWAEWLLAHGYRAAAAREFQAANGESPLSLADDARWTFVTFGELEARVSPLVRDPFFPRAFLTDGKRTLPLAVLLGAPCTRCDENCEVTCSECNGSGTAENYLTGRSYECPPRTQCFHCKGTKFTLYSQHFGKGACPHPAVEREHELGAKLHLVRCTTCGLAALDRNYAHAPASGWDFACGVCGYFECRCSVVASSGSPPTAQEKK